ncbi:MAG: phosphate signaling complex protein PhoU [Candidatus Faecousia sp.]|nr:phosphate signaling complex protein PhoU [Oscillospiraceae bacterium]MDY2557223.1 phosphate signaling complex protein PhoU [Candidatus Faecousia sp.]
MRTKFDEQLRQLGMEMTHMGNLIEKNIQDAVQALLSQDTETARRIMAEDELVDQEQKKIENICFQLLIQQQPVARDLRTITAALKMVTDMERIGDHAADISELTIAMAAVPYPLRGENIRKMAGETIVMLLDAVNSYVNKDIEKAHSVIAHDDIVDNYFVKVKADLIEVIRENPEYGEHAADLLLVNKYLERIGDHATNIAEWVIFALNGNGEANEH